MKFTKAELKVIHSTLVHHLAMLNAISILEEHFAIENGKRIETKETNLIKSILNKIQPVSSKGH
jgi:hypothetical protein